MKPFHQTLQDTLQGTLSQQLDAHQQINQLLQKLRSAVVGGKTDDIQTINQKLLAVSTSLKQLESTRQQQVAGMGFSSTSPLSEILPKLEVNERQELQDLREKLTSTIQQVQQERDSTKSVLMDSARWVGQTLGMIAQHVSPQGQAYTQQQHYGPTTGNKQAASSPNSTKLGQQPPTNSIIERKA